MKQVAITFTAAHGGTFLDAKCPCGWALTGSDHTTTALCAILHQLQHMAEAMIAPL